MKKEYTEPEITKHGKIHELTQGGVGTSGGTIIDIGGISSS